MVNTNKEWTAMSDSAIIETLGDYIKRNRLSQNKTQSLVARDAGVNRWTISQIENGEAISLTSLIQILRALNALDALDNFNIPKLISPIAMANLDQQKRLRATINENKPQAKSEW